MPEPFQFPSPEAAVHLHDQQEANMAALGRQYAAFYTALVAGGVPPAVAAELLGRQQMANLQAWVNAQAG